MAAIPFSANIDLNGNSIVNAAPMAEIIVPFPIGDTSSTTYEPKYQVLVFDASAYPNAKEIVFRALLVQDAAGTHSVWARLNDYVFPGAAIAGSEITASLAQYATSIQETDDIKAALTQGPAPYMVSMKVASGAHGVAYGAFVIRI